MSGQEAGQKKKGFHWPHFKAAPGSEAELERVSQRASSLGRRCAPAWLHLCYHRSSRLPPPLAPDAAGRQLPPDISTCPAARLAHTMLPLTSARLLGVVLCRI